jgi:hypothetical protein
MPITTPAATIPHDRADFDIRNFALYRNVMVKPELVGTANYTARDFGWSRQIGMAESGWLLSGKRG